MQRLFKKIKLIKEYLKFYLVTKDLRITIFRFGTIFVISNWIHFYTAVNKKCLQAFIFKKVKTKFNNESLNILSEYYSCKNIVNAIKESLPNLEINILDSKIINQISNEVLFLKTKTHYFTPTYEVIKGIK